MHLILKCVVTLVILLISIFNVTLVSARVDYTFSDDFNDLNTNFSNWITIDGHSTPIIESGLDKTFATFSNTAPNAFSYIAHKSDDKKVVSLSFDFYGSFGAPTQGSGFMLTNRVPMSSQKPPNDFDYYTFGIWNIGDKYYLLSPLCDYYGGCGMSVYSRAIFEIPRNSWNSISIVFDVNNVTLKLNNLERSFYHDGSNLPNGVFFGNSELTTNPQSWKSFSIDNFYVQYGDPLDSTTTSFPYYSQRDPAWKDLPYDNASVWAGAQANTIERWGCAITSVAMVLKEYGVKMPNGDEANPDKINSWLLSQPDGYVGNGLLNWLAISRMTRESRESGNSDKDLEFTKSFDPPSDDLAAGLFPIIDEGGHFVTLYDQSDDSYLLNDPNNATRSSKLKSELIRSVNTYKPSNTDLSYIMIVADPLIDINVKYTGSLIGTKYDEEVHDDVGGGSTGPGRILYIPKPFAGDYTLIVNNTKPVEGPIKIFSYDKDGNVDVTTQSVIPGTSSWVLSYNPDGTDPTISELDTTPPSYTGTNSFNGWYNAPQTAIFSFADPNLPSDFVSPTCIINKEGINRTCSINVLVCDKYNNCATHNLKSNPANIDLTPPGMVKHIWSIGMRPFSLVSWRPSRDALKYIVEWGTEKNALSNRIESRDSWQWLPTPKIKQLYVKVTVVDRAGNLSNASKLEKINVYPYYWRW